MLQLIKQKNNIELDIDDIIMQRFLKFFIHGTFFMYTFAVECVILCKDYLQKKKLL